MEAKKTAESVNRTQLLSAKELAEMLSVSKRQIFRLHSCGKIPRPLRIGGSIRWDAKMISEWIEQSCPDRASFEALKAG